MNSSISSKGGPQRSWRLWVARLVLLAVVSLLGLGLLEVLVRLSMPRFHPRNQVVHRMNEEGVILGIPLTTCRQGTSKGDFDVTFSFNRHGFRDVKDFTRAGTNDLFVLGDSFSVGLGVEEDQRYSNVLEKRTGATVYNISTPGEDIRGYGRCLRFVHKQGGVVRHLIVGLCMENDLWDYARVPNTHQLYGQQVRRNLRVRFAFWMKTHSALWICSSFTLQKHAIFRRALEATGLARNVEQLTRQNAATPAVLESSRDELLKVVSGVHALVLIIPSRGLWYGANTATEREVHRVFVDSLRKSGLAVLDMRPLFEQAGDPLGCYFKHDPHWNSRGHALAAEALRNHLLQADDWKGLLPGLGPRP